MQIVGNLSIVCLDRGKDLYGVSFLPYQGVGGSYTEKEIAGIDALGQHLRQLGIQADVVNDALQKIAIRGQYSLPNFVASTEEDTRAPSSSV